VPAAFLEPVVPPSLESLPRKKWTRSEIEELMSKGWYPGDGYELIDGELIDKKPGKTYGHMLAVMWIQEWLIGIFRFLPFIRKTLLPSTNVTSRSLT